MSRPGFYNDNAGRDYPFVQDFSPLFVREDLGEGSSSLVEESASSEESLPSQGADEFDLPDSVIVDFLSIMGLAAEFDDELDSVYLHAVRRGTGDDRDLFTFEFRSTAAGLANYGLFFSCTAYEEEGSVIFAEAVELDSAPDAPCADRVRWEGQLVVWSLRDLALLMDEGDGYTSYASAAVITPTLIQNMARHYVRSINLANRNRTHVTAATGCSLDAAPGPYDEDELIVQAFCLDGDIVFREGFNCTIRQSSRDNSLQFGALLAGGAGQPCDEVELYEGEVSPDADGLLTGGPRCNQLIKAVNGLATRQLRLVGGTGVRILSDPDNPHKLIVDVDLHGLAVCSD